MSFRVTVEGKTDQLAVAIHDWRTGVSARNVVIRKKVNRKVTRGISILTIISFGSHIQQTLWKVKFFITFLILLHHTVQICIEVIGYSVVISVVTYRQCSYLSESYSHCRVSIRVELLLRM